MLDLYSIKPDKHIIKTDKSFILTNIILSCEVCGSSSGKLGNDSVKIYEIEIDGITKLYIGHAKCLSKLGIIKTKICSQCGKEISTPLAINEKEPKIYTVSNDNISSLTGGTTLSTEVTLCSQKCLKQFESTATKCSKCGKYMLSNVPWKQINTNYFAAIMKHNHLCYDCAVKEIIENPVPNSIVFEAEDPAMEILSRYGFKVQDTIPNSTFTLGMKIPQDLYAAYHIKYGENANLIIASNKQRTKYHVYIYKPLKDYPQTSSTTQYY